MTAAQHARRDHGRGPCGASRRRPRRRAGRIAGWAALARAATRSVGSGPGFTTMAFRSRTRPRTRIWSRAERAEPGRLRHPRRVRLPLVARSARSARSTGCHGAEAARQVRAADLEARVARAAPVHAGQREPAPHADRLQRRPVRRGGRVGDAAPRGRAAFSGTGITRTEPAAPAAAGATRATSTAAARAARGWGRSADTGVGVVPGRGASNSP